MDEASLDAIIESLLLLRGRRPKRLSRPVAEEEIVKLCSAAREIFLKEPNLLDLQPPINICGLLNQKTSSPFFFQVFHVIAPPSLVQSLPRPSLDELVNKPHYKSDIHGQFPDLLRLLEKGGFPPDATYLFLGDYVDRGKQNIETICLLLSYKVRYPDKLFLLRGNHECRSINRIYGFFDECRRRFSVKLWKVFSGCFDCIPTAALISNTILCMHGGLSPSMKSLDDIREIERPIEIPNQGLLCDLLWSDPCWINGGWHENEERGVSYTFGAAVLKKFLEDHNLDLICRGHQVVEDGYQLFADRKLVTIFSAPNYCGEFDNNAAMMTIDKDLLCSFKVINPVMQKYKCKMTFKGLRFTVENSETA